MLNLAKVRNSICEHRPWQECECSKKNEIVDNYQEIKMQFKELKKLFANHLDSLGHDSYCSINENGCCSCSVIIIHASLADRCKKIDKALDKCQENLKPFLKKL